MGVTMTPAATERVKSFMVNRGKGLGLRLGIKTTGCSGLAYVLEFVDDLNEDDELFGEFENVNSVNSEEMKNKKTCNFMINPTTLPDIYELYCYSSNNNIEKYAYASVPNIDTSNYIKSIVNFDNISENVLTKIKRNNATFVECEYHKVFKKWIPIKKVNEMDNITIINQTQIILDSQ